MAQNLLPYGLGTPDLVEFQSGYFVCKDICGDLTRLDALLAENGFRLRLESVYRPFEKQLSIWNRKPQASSRCSMNLASPCSAHPTKKN